MHERRPLVSVVVPCRNEAVSIQRTMESILASDYPRIEVIVADGASQDGTRELLAGIASRDSRLRVLDNPDKITPAGLNLAIQAAQGELILRVDAHSVIAGDYISKLVDFLERTPDAWGAGGQMRTEPETQGWFSQAIPLVLSHKFGVGNSQFRTGEAAGDPRRADTVFNCCWRREVFERVGLFHEKLARSQDIEMSTRIGSAGGALWWVPTAHTTYFARIGFGSYLKHNWSNGVWSVLPAAYLGHLPVRWRHLVPLAFVSAVNLSCVLAAAVPALGWLPLLSLIPYLGVNLAVSWQGAMARRSARLAVLLPPAFAGLHIGYGAGSLWGLLKLAAHVLSFHSYDTRTNTRRNAAHPFL